MVRLVAEAPERYLAGDDVVETSASSVVALAAELRRANPADVDFSRAAFEWVRDEVAHNVDARDPRVTVTATEVLAERVGLCFAKSHLLTALLRTGGVPAGLCYQRLTDGEGFVLHGLVAVHLDDGWHRLDARGNKLGIDARFSLQEEHLAWSADPAAGEIDYPQVYVSPARVVLATLASAHDALALCDGGLPPAL